MVPDPTFFLIRTRIRLFKIRIRIRNPWVSRRNILGKNITKSAKFTIATFANRGFQIRPVTGRIRLKIWISGFQNIRVQPLTPGLGTNEMLWKSGVWYRAFLKAGSGSLCPGKNVAGSPFILTYSIYLVASKLIFDLVRIRIQKFTIRCSSSRVNRKPDPISLLFIGISNKFTSNFSIDSSDISVSEQYGQPK